MNIAGIQKTTLVDYPGKVAATVFTRGCTFQCPFCHNPELVLPAQFGTLIPEADILEFFEKRIGQLEAVCITGGEPTIQTDIAEFISKLKKMGFLVKLDTNGSLPDVLESLIKSGNLDYIAMDIKSSLQKYPLVSGTKNLNIKNIERSIKLIMNSGIDYEFRTTVCHPLHKVEDFEEIGKLIKGAKRYYIQNFVHSKHIDEDQDYKPMSDENLVRIKNILKKFVGNSSIR